MSKFASGASKKGKAAMAHAHSSSSSGVEARSWDPLVEDVTPLRSCIMRVQHDIRNIHADPIPGILVVPDDDDITLCYALIIGPEGTPYEGGFFYFVLRFPYNYPLSPPRVRNLTTDNACVRFNPNLYSNGKVCLSILGTWSGPPWSPAQTLSSVLISIQSLMNDEPYFNEPGYHQERFSGQSRAYKSYLMHETIRVAVCDNVSHWNTYGRQMPKKLRFAMLSFFSDFYDHYVAVCDREVSCDGTEMHDPFNNLKSCTKFQFGHLKTRLASIKETIDDEIRELSRDSKLEGVNNISMSKKESEGTCNSAGDNEESSDIHLKYPPADVLDFEIIDVDDDSDNSVYDESEDVKGNKMATSKAS